MRLAFAISLPAFVLCGTVLAADPSFAAPPSFDCAKADTSATQLVCKDDQLAALDREVTRLFTLARDGAHLAADQRKQLLAVQRGWIKGRDDCWKAGDLRACVVESYVTRIHQLRQGYADARSQDKAGISKGPFAAKCEGLDALLTLAFVDIKPAAADVGWLDQAVVVNQVPAASGARYQGENYAGKFEFWQHGKEMTFTMPGGKPMICAPEETG